MYLLNLVYSTRKTLPDKIITGTENQVQIYWISHVSSDTHSSTSGKPDCQKQISGINFF